MENMRVLLLGSGGREHALAWKIAQSSMLEKLFIAPGNGGTLQHGENVDLKETDQEAVRDFIVRERVNLVVVGPEAPLVAGLRDFLEADSSCADVRIIGPGKAGAELEGSKAYAKRFMMDAGIPTARYGEFDASQLDEAKAFLDTLNPPYVIKADGLAAGKGVVILDTKEEAYENLESFLQGGKFGAAGSRVVIEEFLDGIELSVFVLTDGKTAVTLPEAKDYKRIGEGDTGLNTGGMGSISPVMFADEAFMAKVQAEVIDPTISELQKRTIPYTGFIFFGLMKVGAQPYVIEYNVRMGDPETETVMRRIEGDFLEAMWLTGGGEANQVKLASSAHHAACIMLVSGGYPEAYEKGKTIEIEEINDEDVVLFHAGTKATEDGLMTSGGRVIAVGATGASMSDALSRANDSVKKVRFDRMNYRSDIGFDLE